MNKLIKIAAIGGSFLGLSSSVNAQEYQRVVGSWKLVEKTSIERKIEKYPKPYCYESVVRTPDGGCHKQINSGYTIEQRVIETPVKQYQWQWQECSQEQQVMIVVPRRKAPVCEFLEGAINFPCDLIRDLTEPCRRPSRQYGVPVQSQLCPPYAIPTQPQVQPRTKRPLVPVAEPEPQPTLAPPRP